ncbi:MAG: DNA polymerase III subunit beta [Clostridiales bacterium]|jgi:DNA polymerase-3 subunit beta|nr:DNA polymerase III subunit beta [Clostridiales bacterium]
MKFTCNLAEIQEATNATIKVSSSSSPQIELMGIYIVAKGDNVVLTCNNLELSIEDTINAKVEEQGEIILHARLFSDILNKLSGETVSIETKSNGDDSQILTVKAGRSKFDLTSLTGNNFPTTPIVDSAYEVTIIADVLKDLIKSTAFAAGVLALGKRDLTGCLLEVTESCIRMVALDGYRLALCEYAITDKSSIGKVTIPAKSLTEWLKIAPDEPIDVKIKASDKFVAFEYGNIRWTSRVIAGDFVDYNKIIPAEWKTTITMPKARVQLAVERAATVILGDIAKAPISIDITADGLNFECTTTAGNAEDMVNVAVNGDNFKIGFNHRFLLEALRNVHTEDVKIEMISPHNPALITPIEKDDKKLKSLHLVLPVKL